MEIKWWGYLHTDGSVHVKRYFGPEDLVEARESPFVRSAYGPFDAENHFNARDILLARIKGGRS